MASCDVRSTVRPTTDSEPCDRGWLVTNVRQDQRSANRPRLLVAVVFCEGEGVHRVVCAGEREGGVLAMVYLEDWSEFLAAAEELYRAAPLKVRPCVSLCAAACSGACGGGAAQ